MRQQLLPIYGWAMVIAVLAFAIGMKVQHRNEQMGYFHQMFHHQPSMFDWLHCE